jgi:integrase
LRVRPTGKMTYFMDLGKTMPAIGIAYEATGSMQMEPTDARAIAKKLVAQYQDPTYKPAPTPIKFGEFVSGKYLTSHLEASFVGSKREHNISETLKCLTGQFPEFSVKHLSDITALEIDGWKQRQLKQGKKPSSVNRYLNNLRACLNKAVEWELLDKAPKIKMLKVDTKGKVRYLGQYGVDENGIDEESRLRAALKGSPLEAAALVSLTTGLRQDELLSLTWNNVQLDGDNQHITVEGDLAKGHVTRHVPLGPEALEILRGLKKDSFYVFPDDNGGKAAFPRKRWITIVKRAKLKDFRWHDLRHDYASKLVMRGTDLLVVKELMGHSSYELTLRYAHLAPDRKREAVVKTFAIGGA